MAERYIPEHRRTQFKAKNTFKPDELRRRREEQQVEIRKAKREENLAKRRGIGTGDNRPGASLGAAPDSEDENPPTESQVCHQQPPAAILPLPLPSLCPSAAVPLPAARSRPPTGGAVLLPSPAPFRHRPCACAAPSPSPHMNLSFEARISNNPPFWTHCQCACQHQHLASPGSSITTACPSQPPPPNPPGTEQISIACPPTPSPPAYFPQVASMLTRN